HFGHFLDGDGGKMKIYFYLTQQQITAATLKGIFCKVVREVSSVEVRSFRINPGSEKHRSFLSGHMLSGNKVGQHFHLLFMVLKQFPRHHMAPVTGLQEVERTA